MIQLVNDRFVKGQALRVVVVETLQSLMDTNKHILALEADLGDASKFTTLEKSHPDRLIQCGIAEANMIGVAAGLSLVGYRPFVHSFAPFLTRRVYDQLFISGAYANTTINLYGSDPGFTVGTNGGTHSSWEDIALLRVIPKLVICDAADAVQMEWIIRSFAQMEGIHYVRANRKSVRNVYTPTSTFVMGKGNTLREGEDVLIITAGQLVSDALDCGEMLAQEGIQAQIIDMFCIKPLDYQLIQASIAHKRLVVTFENHSIIGGLGSAVAEVLAQMNQHAKLLRLGVNDAFGQVGTPDFLQKEYHLCASDLFRAIKQSLPSL